MEVYEVVFSPKLKGACVGGVVGSSDGKKLGVIVYEQPPKADFDLSPTAPVPRMTTRKMKNRNYREGKADRRKVIGVDGNGASTGDSARRSKRQ